MVGTDGSFEPPSALEEGVIETAIVIDRDDLPVHWHLPPGRTAVAIPDSRELWNVLWKHRETLGGIAHTHPGGGIPVPSKEDLTTFAACEAGLGRRLRWWIVTRDNTRCYAWSGPGRLEYDTCRDSDEVPDWVDELRAESYGNGHRRAS